MNEDNENQLALKPTSTAMVDVAVSRAAQEVQAAMVIAKRFPRNELESYNRIMDACKRKTLAEESLYEYKRGGTPISGPSIRLAETMARAWGNLDFGVVEVDQSNGESTVMAYAWDLETNTRSTRIFHAKHERHTREGVKKLTDPRDIYELTANQGARRVRACILNCIPSDVVEAAIAQCNKTLTSGEKEPLLDRAKKMVTAYSELFVTQAMIERKIGHKIEAITETEMARLKKVYVSIRDGFGSREDHFGASEQEMRSGLQSLAKTKPSAEEPPTDEENARRIELAEAVRQKWADDGLNRAGQIAALRGAGAKEVPTAESGDPDLEQIPSTILATVLTGEASE